MLFAPSQIVGLIEIETLDSDRSDQPIALGQEEGSLTELFTWLTQDASAPRSAESAGEHPASTAPVRRLSSLLHRAADCLPADLEQLRSDLADATARLRLRLSAAG